MMRCMSIVVFCLFMYSWIMLFFSSSRRFCGKVNSCISNWVFFAVRYSLKAPIALITAIVAEKM